MLHWHAILLDSTRVLADSNWISQDSRQRIGGPDGA